MKGPPEGPLHCPSRFRFRPPSPLTFGFRLRPSSGASTYLRPVLGAIGRLGGVGSRCKVANGEQFALCELFFFQHVPSNLSNLWKSSPVPAMFSTDSSGAGLTCFDPAAVGEVQASPFPQCSRRAVKLSVERRGATMV